MNHDKLDADRRCDDHVLARCAAGSLSAAEEQLAVAHLDDCPRCRIALERMVASPTEMAELQTILGDGEGGDDDGEDGSGGETVSRAGLVRSVSAFLRPSDDDAMLGRLGPYEIAGVIGSGGMGVVLKGWDRALDRFVAIKVLAPHLATSGAARKRFLREARAAAAVVHDNVIAIHGVAETDGIPYLVMPYCRGTTLEKRLRESGALETREILRIGMQTARGLAAAHGQGLVHRDVKPANILLDDGVERVLLTDFGLARAADDASLTRTGTLAGTPHYMSPEQATGGQVDQRSDLFALGGVMYAMATGHAPFRAESCHAVLRLVAESRAPDVRVSNPDVPPWLAGSIAKLLSKEPVERFQSAGELANLLEACLAHVNDPLGSPLPESVVTAPLQMASTGTSPPLLHRILETMSDQRFLARVSVGLFIAALLVPWLIAALGRDIPAVFFGIVAGLLAITFAWLGREEPLAQTVLKLYVAALGIGLVAFGGWLVVEKQIAYQQAALESAVAVRIAKEKSAELLNVQRQLEDARAMRQDTIGGPGSGGMAGGYGTVGGMGGRMAGEMGPMGGGGSMMMGGPGMQPPGMGMPGGAPPVMAGGMGSDMSGGMAPAGMGSGGIGAGGLNQIEPDQKVPPGVNGDPFSAESQSNFDSVPAGSTPLHEAPRGVPTLEVPATSTPSPPVPSSDGTSSIGDLEGVWEVTPPGGGQSDEDGPFRIALSQDSYVDLRGETPIFASSLTVDPHASPKRLSFSDGSGNPIHGIYEVQGDGLRMFTVPASEPWPTRFPTDHHDARRVLDLDAREIVSKLPWSLVQELNWPPLTPSPTVPPSESTSSIGALEGVWELMPPPRFKPDPGADSGPPLRFVFIDGIYARLRGETPLEVSPLTVDQHASPGRLSFRDETGRPVNGIYDVQGDGLRLSIAPATEPWPTRFGTDHPEFHRVTKDHPEILERLRKPWNRNLIDAGVD